MAEGHRRLRHGFALAPDDHELYGIRGFAHAYLGQPAQSVRDYSAAIRLAPAANAGSFTSRARGLAILGQWDAAARDLDQAFRLNAASAERWMDLGCYRAAAGDLAAYRIVCAAMLGRFGQTKDAVTAHQVALVCFLVPRPAAELKTPVQLAEFSAAHAANRPWCVLTCGAGLYRTGQFVAAVRRLEPLERQWRNGPGPDGRVAGWLLLAMAHHRLGHAQDARRHLRQAAEAMDRELAAPDIGPLRRAPNVWAMCLILRHEAAALLNKRG